jgi:hypothetical protein
MTIKYSKQSKKYTFSRLYHVLKRTFILYQSLLSLMNITRNYSFVGASIIMGLLLIVSVTVLPNLSFAQQENQTNMTSSQQQNQSGGNQTGGGQEGQQQQQQQNQTGIGTSQELENLTGLSNETIANNTDIESPNATTMGGLEKEQTSTETTNMSSTQQQNQSGQQQQQNQSGGNQTGGGQGQNQTQQGPLEQLGETLGGIFGGGSQ